MSTTIYSQDFQASTSLPTGWNFAAGYAIDATSKLTGANSLAITSTSLSPAVYATMDGVSGNAQGEVTFRVDSPGTSSQVNLYGRMSDATVANVATTANFYRAIINLGSAPTSWMINRRIGGASTTLLTTTGAINTAITAGTLLSAATAYRGLLVANGGTTPGTTVSLYLQRVSDGFYLNGSGTWQANATACMEVVDTTPITGQGYFGFSTVLASGATAYFDDFALVNYADTTTYIKTWGDYSGFDSGVGTLTPGLFNGGVDAGLALPTSSTVTYSTTSAFNDRQYGNTITGYFPFNVTTYSAGQTFYFRVRDLSIIIAGYANQIRLEDRLSGTSYATVGFTSANRVNGRTYVLYFRLDGTAAKIAIKDSTTGNFLGTGGTFAAGFVWCINYTLAAPHQPGMPIQLLNPATTGGSAVSVGPIKVGPCGTPQVTPSTVTIAAGGSQAFVPLYFAGVDTVNTASAGTFSGNTYNATGGAGTPTVTFTGAIGGEAVSPTVTVTGVVATSYAITGPTRGFVGLASGTFTVTPNGTSSATVTITPSGGGLSTPITVTFDGTATAQTFTITPTAAGTVTLTPTNSGSLTNPSAPTYTSMALLASAYVATSGSDSTGDGSIGSPFATPAYALTGLASTGTIYCNGGDTFAPIEIGRDNVTIRGYGTGLPIFSGTSSTIHGAIVHGTNCQSITLDGLKVVNTGTTGSAVQFSNTDATRRSAGMVIQNCDLSGGEVPFRFESAAATTGGWNNVQILNNKVYNGLGLGIYLCETGSTSTNRHYSNVLIRGNEVYSISGASKGTGSGIVLGNADSITGTGAAQCVIELNHVHDCGALAAGGAGPAGIFPIYSDGVMVQDNLVHDIHATGGGVDGDGLDSDQQTSNCTFQRNYCYNCGGPGMLLYQNNDGIIVRWNVFANCGQQTNSTLGGLHLGGSGSAVVHNNVFWMAAAATIPALKGANTAGTTNKKIYNNIFISNAGNRVVDLPTLAAGFNLQGNAYQAADNTATFRFNGADTTTLADFRTASGQESGTRGFITSSPIVGYSSAPPATTDPTTIRSLTAFNLPAGSPLYHTGLDLATLFSVNPGTTDYHNNAISTPYSVGASDTPPTATTFTLTGPSSGIAGSASTNFTVTPNATYTGTITITPSGGGLSTPIVLTFSGSATPQTFTITPTSSGAVTLTPSNNGSLSNPSALTYTANPATATSFTLTGPTTGAINVASSNFTVTPNGPFTGNITITPSGGGLSTPIVKAFSGTSTAQTFTITPTAAGTVTLTPSNDGSISNPSALTYTATNQATGYTLTASPGSVAVNGVATITATLTGGTTLASSLVITLADDHPATISGTITIAPGSTSGTATITATVDGTHAITATHTGGGFTGGDGSTQFIAGATATVSIFLPSIFLGSAQ